MFLPHFQLRVNIGQLREDMPLKSQSVGRLRTIRFAIALAIGLAAPYADLAWKCRTGFTASEACVWGKSYMPLTRWAMLVMLTPAAYGVQAGMRWLWLRHRNFRDL